MHIMKVDTTRFYRIVISTTKVKTLNMTGMYIEEVGRSIEKRSKPACTLYIVTKYLFLQFTLYNKPLQSNIIFNSPPRE